MASSDRYTPRVDHRVDQRARRLVGAVEAFVGRLGAELSTAQHELKPKAFARFVDTLGIGRTKVDQLMAAARAQVAVVDDVRPSAWWIIFGKIEPIPMLPGEAAPIIDYAVAQAEPPAYRRRVDLLSADGIMLTLCALHQPEALSPAALQRFSAWLAGEDVSGDAANELRGWRTMFTEDGHDDPSSDTRDGSTQEDL